MHYALIDDQTRVTGDAEERFEHLVRVVDEAAGLQTAAQPEIAVDPGWQKLAPHTLVVLRDGKRVNRLDRKRVRLLQRGTRLERQIYDGRVTASIVLDDIRVGDRLEYSYSVRGRNPVFDGRFVDRNFMAAIKGPVGIFRVRLLAPEGRDIRIRIPKDTQMVQNVTGGQRETLIWIPCRMKSRRVKSTLIEPASG